MDFCPESLFRLGTYVMHSPHSMLRLDGTPQKIGGFWLQIQKI